MAKVRVFVSVDYDHDEDLKTICWMRSRVTPKRLPI